LLMDYCQGFFGYGNPGGKYWFIGLEEAGGGCKEIVRHRLDVWDQKFKRRQIVDCREFHRELASCDDRLIRLIRVQLACEGQEATKDKISAVRENNWGRTEGGNCLLELLPLPSPRTKEWLYEKWTKLPDFRTKPEYRNWIIQRRLDGLKELVERQTPKVVVIYGRGRKRWTDWSQIVGFNWDDVDPHPCPMNGKLAQFRRRKETMFALIDHPASHGIPLNYFTWVGEEIRARVQQQSAAR
jgi:hypothetical protein